MSQIPPQQLQQHIPVLLKDVLSYLRPMKGETYLDLTAGYGGHAKAVIEKLGNDASLATLVDRDQTSEIALKPLVAAGARFIRSDFASAAASLLEEGEQFDVILTDLGVSSPQLNQAERGFSFMHDGPLDMRMDQRQELTAADIVNNYSVDMLSRLIRTYGEDSRARKIAQAIFDNRPYTTTNQLAEAIARTVARTSRIHPATRTFQALRIELNHELEQVKTLLPLLPRLLKPGGRVAIISFHSLEDRLVKQYFAEVTASGYEAELQILTKKPIAGATNDVSNPRARSAKLRAAVKIKRKGATDAN